MSTPISVVVCTLNEVGVIDRLIGAVGWADEILVLDSGSEDTTPEHAAALGATVHEQPWLGFSAQKNRAASLARHDWVLSLDADEVVSPALAASIAEVCAGPMDLRDGYVVDRRGDFLGKVLPNGSRRSKRRTFVRLYNRRASRWDEAQAVHEQVICEGRRIPLQGPLLHVNEFTIDELLERYLGYATVEACAAREAGGSTSAAAVVARPILRFLWHYIATGEFRLGGHGVVHSGTRAASEFMRLAKLWELQQAWAPLRKPARGVSTRRSD